MNPRKSLPTFRCGLAALGMLALVPALFQTDLPIYVARFLIEFVFSPLTR